MHTDSFEPSSKRSGHLKQSLLATCFGAALLAAAAGAPAGAADSLKIIPFLTTENDPATLNVLGGIFESYSKEHSDVAVDVTLGSHGDVGQRFTTAAAVGGDMAIVQVPARDINDFANSGLLLPIDDLVQAIGEDQFSPGAVFRGLDGKAYALAYTGGTHGTVWVRDDMLQEAGLAPPKTYEEFLAAAKAMTKDTDGDGRPDVYGFGIPGGADGATDARFINFVYQECADFFDWDGNLVFNRPEALEALKRYIAMFEYSPPGAVGWSWLDGIDAFIGGRIAMHPYGGRLGVNLNRAAPEIRAKTSVIPLEVGSVDAARGGWDYIAIYAKTRYPDVSKDVLGYFLSPDQLKKVALTVPGHLIPPIASVSEAVLASDDPYVQKFHDDVATLFKVGTHVADPALSMGALDVSTCKFNPVPNPMPWGSKIFAGSPPIIAEMIQRITVDHEPVEEAWKWGYTRMGEVADEWKAANPGWKAPPKP